MDKTRTSDQNDLHELVAALVDVRVQQKLRQSDVARVLKIGQPAISEFERGVFRPRVDTVQKYARAVGARVLFTVEAPPPPQDTDNGQNGTEQ